MNRTHRNRNEQKGNKSRLKGLLEADEGIRWSRKCQGMVFCCRTVSISRRFEQVMYSMKGYIPCKIVLPLTTTKRIAFQVYHVCSNESQLRRLAEGFRACYTPNGSHDFQLPSIFRLVATAYLIHRLINFSTSDTQNCVD